MKTRRGYAIALTAASLALVGSMGAATAYAVSTVYAPAGPAAAQPADWNDGPGWMMDPDTMMGGTWASPADFTVTAEQARAKAQAWIATREPGATLGDAYTVPMGYRFTVSLNGKPIGVVMVNGTTGAVAGHAITPGSSSWTDNWHGMMGQNWNTGASFTITDTQAAAAAKDWLSSREPGASLGRATRTPMGYRFTVSLNGSTIGVVMVNGVSGRVTGHAITGTSSGQHGWNDNWHGMMGNWSGNGSGNWDDSGWGGMMR